MHFQNVLISLRVLLGLINTFWKCIRKFSGNNQCTWDIISENCIKMTKTDYDPDRSLVLIERLSHFVTNFLQNLASCQTAFKQQKEKISFMPQNYENCNKQQQNKINVQFDLINLYTLNICTYCYFAASIFSDKFANTIVF
jgi:hypothetical protein